jgi:hypothetical protein
VLADLSQVAAEDDGVGAQEVDDAGQGDAKHQAALPMAWRAAGSPSAARSASCSGVHVADRPAAWLRAIRPA